MSLRRRSFAVAGCAALIVVACGSRTGLFVDELGPLGSAPGADAGPETGPQPIPCVPGRFTFELALTQLMFVIDRSGSMAFDLAGNGGPGTDIPDDQTRWRILQRALSHTITTFDQQISMGAKFFPEVLDESQADDSVEACRTDVGVAIPPARGNATKILGTFDTTRPLGGTPTSEAVRIAAQYLTQSRSIARTLVLATDGAPNCNTNIDFDTCVCTSPAPCDRPSRASSCLDDTRTVNTIRDVAQTQKIPVYVIGIGNDTSAGFTEVLDQMAEAGGRPLPDTPHYYPAESETQLSNALQGIRDSVTKCTYLTPSAPTNPNAISVAIGGVQIPRDQTKTNGWDWIDQTFGELAFFGDACTKAQGGGGTSAFVDGVVSCD
jgi:hypothetical protein